MMKQYWDVKNRHPDYLLFYRMGDFFELFYEDAIIAARDLEITLTKRGKQEGDDIPMCGVPAHSHELYLAKLIQKGHKVAICEQLESPEEAKKRGAKGPLQRDVIRIVTPGTLTEDSLLPAKRNNFLVALSPILKAQIGVATIDVSTGFFTVETTSLKNLNATLSRIEPAEIVMPDPLLEDPELIEVFNPWKKQLSPLPRARFDLENGRKRLETLYNVQTLDAFGDLNDAELMAAGALVDYLYITQKQSLQQHIERPQVIREQMLLAIDPATRRSLELTQTQKGEFKGSLLDCMDHTITAFGSRLLAQQLSAPLLNVNHIKKRLDQVEFFVNHSDLREEVRSILKLCPDMERCLSRLGMGRGSPRDLGAMKQGLYQTITLLQLWQGKPETPFSKWIDALKDHENLYDALNQTLSEELPIFTRDGGFIKEGYNQNLDHYRNLRNHSRDLVNQLQQSYVQKTGISNLKIKHNFILGYHIDISPSHASKMTPEFIHRQTLASSVRYTTVELAELEKSIEAAAQETLTIELAIFDELLEKIRNHFEPLLKLSKALAHFDVASALSELAIRQNYNRPEIDNSFIFSIKGGRHPIVAQALGSDSPFVANDCQMNDSRRILLLTGPNMAGKSTYLRQNALITIMAQMGSFVPAEKAHIGIVDRVFSRVGASDDLASGRSTFMVEMVETATILHQATKRSFVILDEIGRGTATYDGLAIAWAVIEAIYNTNQCRTMFATHYHELTKLVDDLPHMACLTMKIQEWQQKVIFLHQVIPGCADKSYGVHVAALAGLPTEVVERADKLLLHFEKQQPSHKRQLTLPMAVAPKSAETKPSKIEGLLKAQDLDQLTPRQALDFLYQMREALLQEEGSSASVTGLKEAC
ncbi:MAG: DNA mismatch repair protein MutS [Alphaproteobacteria bacterium]|nr:DNA mismatch repair protein MutS [Alphaproteobacteria bacterium]